METSPPDRAEIDPENWWEATSSVIRQALGDAGATGNDLAAVGLSGLMHAPVLIDAKGRSLLPAQLWLDQRCASQAAALKERLAGHVPPLDLRTSVSAPKLAWIAENDPQALAAASSVLLPKDFIRYRLTGDLATDISDAYGTGLFDLVQGAWMTDVAEAVGLLSTQLPLVRRADEPGGRITAQGAASCGLSAGTPVATGGSDGLCARLGTGILPRGTKLIYLGTAAWVAVVDGTDEIGGIHAVDAGATTSTGAAMRWVRSILAGPKGDRFDYAELDRLAKDVPPGSAGVMFFPHLMGERGPKNIPAATAAWTGLTLGHDQSHMIRSVMEGTAFQLRMVLEDSFPTHAQTPVAARVTGGVCASKLWLQIMADVTGLSLEIPGEPETPAMGAALLGGRAAGLVEQKLLWRNPIERVVVADPAAHREYDIAYKRFVTADQSLLG